MTVGFRASFAKDLETIHDVRVLGRVEKVILALERAKSLGEVPQIKRLHGHPQSYRARIGDYRLGLRVEGKQVDCVRILHRREIYRYFP